jgi:hypothetical protein
MSVMTLGQMRYLGGRWRRRAAVGMMGALCALALFACTDNIDDPSVPTPPAQDSNPAARQLYQSLVNVPVQARELPPGFSDPRIERGDLDDTARQFRAIGQVTVGVTGPDTSDSFGYIVYPDADAARQAFAAHEKDQATTEVSFTPSGFNAPAVCIDDQSDVPVTACVVVVDNVEVYGLAIAGSRGSVVALTTSGITHLLGVRSAK